MRKANTESGQVIAAACGRLWSDTHPGVRFQDRKIERFPDLAGHPTWALARLAQRLVRKVEELTAAANHERKSRA